MRVEEVFSRYSGGPQDGVFTDGSCSPNPGPGGWGVAWLKDGQLVQQLHGHDPDTTNNRMELLALIEAMKMLDEAAQVIVYTDSQLCANTINQWAKGWAARGWKRKSGPIKNLELVQELYALKQFAMLLAIIVFLALLRLALLRMPRLLARVSGRLAQFATSVQHLGLQAK